MYSVIVGNPGHSSDRSITDVPLHDDSISRSELVLNTSGLHQLQRIGQYQHHPQALQQQRHDVAGTGVGNGGSQTSGSGVNADVSWDIGMFLSHLTFFFY